MPLKAFHKIYEMIYVFPLIIIVGNAYLCLPTLKPIQNNYHFSDTRTKNAVPARICTHQYWLSAVFSAHNFFSFPEKES